MRRSLWALLGIVLIQGCWAQTGDLPPAVNLFLELSTNHEVDKQWRKANIGLIFHPGFDYLGLMPRYEGIQEVRPIVHGEALFLSAKIVSALKVKAWVDYSRPNKEPEDALYVRIDYSIVASLVDDKLTVLDHPVTAQQYIVLAVDTDGKQKVIGAYPSLKSQHFIGARYFLANFETYSGDKSMKDKLAKAVGP